MTLVQRYDILHVDAKKSKKTDNGFLKAPVLATRTGIFTYRRADGSLFKELRMPEEVFNTDSLESLKNIPVTNDHPRTDTGQYLPVTAANAKQFAIGMVGDNVRRDGEAIATDVIIFDGDGIKDIESGRQQVSCGYLADMDMTPGIYNGERYDAIQRNIRYNHLAVVDHGRAGPKYRLHLDSGGAVMVDGDDVGNNSNLNQGEANMAKLKIDGVEYEASEALAAAVTNALAKRDEHAAKLDGQVKNLTDEAKKLDTVQAKCDSLEADLKKAKEEVAKHADGKSLQAAVKARMSLVEVAKGRLAEDTKLDDMSDRDIKIAVIKADCPEFTDEGKSDAYIDARYDHVTEMTKSDGDLKGAISGVDGARGAKNDSADEARQKSMKADSEAWMKPIGTAAKAVNA